MRHALAAALIFLCAPSWAFAQEGKRHAVLVGVNEYQHDKLAKLKYAVNDAAELGALLEKAGYSVTVLTDDTGKKDAKLAPTKANVEARLRSVLDSAKKGDLVLACFAGHGLQFDGDGEAYFCPADAKPFKDRADTLVSLKKVYEEMDRSYAGMKVLLVDACRDDPSGSRGVGADTAPRPPSGVAAIFSCKAGQRAFEVPKYKHGVFFYHVITGLQGEAADKRGRVTFAALASHVGQEVPGDVASLIGGGAVQTPNVKAEYASEPLLIAGAVPNAVGARTEDEQILADLRAYERAGDMKRGKAFLREEGPKRFAVWKKAAEGGNPAGQVLLAGCFMQGILVDKDDQEAVRWYKKAAEAGSESGISNLGFMYSSGQGVEKDEKEAVRLYRKAIEAGSVRANSSLGAMYATGRGVEKDEKEAMRLFKLAADAGSAQGMSNLAVMYANGRGVEKDDNESFKWYRKAAEAGNTRGMYHLGVRYENGRGVEKDDKEAVRWYRKAAEAEYPMGMNNLGVMYSNGRGVEKDHYEAFKWFQKAAEAGEPLGMSNLGNSYANGRGVGRDEKEGVKWYRMAADAGGAAGMRNLGSAYEKGVGVPMDRGEAVKWYRKAAEAGDDAAKKALERLGEK